MSPPSLTTEELESISLNNFLSQIYPKEFSSLNLNRPFITLTYAQSLDGKIAGIGNQQIMLSGPESMKLTHKYVVCFLFHFISFH